MPVSTPFANRIANRAVDARDRNGRERAALSVRVHMQLGSWQQHKAAARLLAADISHVNRISWPQLPLELLEGIHRLLIGLGTCFALLGQKLRAPLMMVMGPALIRFTYYLCAPISSLVVASTDCRNRAELILLCGSGFHQARVLSTNLPSGDTDECGTSSAAAASIF